MDPGSDVFYCKLEDANKGNLQMYFAGTAPRICRCLDNIVPRASIGMLKFCPTMVLAKVVLLVGQVFGSLQGPYLYGMPALGFLMFLPSRMRSFARLSVKEANLREL